MTGSDIQRLLDYLASDRLGFQYTGNVARRAHVQVATPRSPSRSWRRLDFTKGRFGW